MSNIITQTIEQISKEKNIDPKVIIDALEDAMVASEQSDQIQRDMTLEP